MSKQQLLQDLIAAKALIDAPEKWIQGEYGVDKDGQPIFEGSWGELIPACMCSIGALAQASGRDPIEVEHSEAATLLSTTACGQSVRGAAAIVRYNDEHSHAEVMAVWDNAIATAQVAVQIENLEVLRAAVQEQPEDLFDLTKYKQERPCGTLFCTIGLASTMPHFQALGVTLVAEPRGSDRHPFIVAKVNGENAYESDYTNELFGPHAFDNLFNPADVGDLDCELGYELAYDDKTDTHAPNMTDKELAVARLTYQIELLKEQA